MKQELIEKIKANPEKYAFENDGTVEQLNEVLGIICPLDNRIGRGGNDYYWHYSNSHWDSSITKPKNREIIKISEIFAETFEYGELIEVRDSDNQEWKERIHIATLPKKATHRYITVSDIYEDEFHAGDEFSWIYYKQARKIQKEEPKETKDDNSIAPSTHLSPEHIRLAMQNRWCKVPEGMEQAVTDRMNELKLWADANIVRHCNRLRENIGLRASRNGFTHGWDESYIDSHDLSEVPFSYFAALIGLEYKEPTIITYSIEPDGLKLGWKAESIPINEKTEAEINNFIERLKELKNE